MSSPQAAMAPFRSGRLRSKHKNSMRDNLLPPMLFAYTIPLNSVNTSLHL
jgi:hypothetical protein